MPEAGRQVICGGVIILMLLVYGRSRTSDELRSLARPSPNPSRFKDQFVMTQLG
jgi:hypothetical protein